MVDYVQLISTVGFPISMCMWFMFRTEKIITANTQALQKLEETIQQWKK